LPLRAVLGLHIAAGLVAVVAGAGAALSAKGGRRHRRSGLSFAVALSVVVATAAVLAATDWAHLWHLFVLAVLAGGCAAVGYAARHRSAVHLWGMGGAYIAMLTAFYVDNGPRLPGWRLLPPVAFWVLPALVGLPLLVRATRRHRRRHAPRRPRAAR
jgi:hypothetical protein